MNRYGQFFSCGGKLSFCNGKGETQSKGEPLNFYLYKYEGKMRFGEIIGGREQSGWKGKGEGKNTVVIFTKREAHKKPLFGKKNNKNKW